MRTLRLSLRILWEDIYHQKMIFHDQGWQCWLDSDLKGV
jgi:hypothetical protein